MIKLITGLIMLLIIGAVGAVIWYIYMKLRFKTVPSNEALIITGTNLGNPEKEPNIFKDENGRYMKVIRGGGHRLGLFQTSTKISLKSFQLKLLTPKVYTSQGVGVYGEAVATVKIADSLKGIVQYAEQFLGKKQKEIEMEVSEILGSNLRAILSQLSVEEINSDRNSFNEMVREIAQEQLDRMGFHITSLGLTDLRDDEEYLESLGKPKIAEIKKIADIAESTNMRETETHIAKMNQEVAEEKYKREIEIAESRKERDIKDAKILAETSREKAKSEAAYRLEEEERNLEIERKRLEILQQEKERTLKLKRLERENEVKLEKEQVEIQKQKIEADYLRKTREAQALAETERLRGETEAKIKRLTGEAEADVIRNKANAEVEALEKRAKAINKHKDVIITEKLIDILPQYAEAISHSLSNVESIRILDGGSGDQIKSLPNTVTGMMANMNEGLGQMTGIDLTKLINNMADIQDETVIDKDTINNAKKQVQNYLENQDNTDVLNDTIQDTNK